MVLMLGRTLCGGCGGCELVIETLKHSEKAVFSVDSVNQRKEMNDEQRESNEGR
jgi:Fe-S cluster biogenesis protein NfuA